MLMLEPKTLYGFHFVCFMSHLVFVDNKIKDLHIVDFKV
jgi:hypothetical protein